ncbi:hypothetical protein MFUL124B02_04440 [Myxococcus fulvus 124B02]|nr:hypothetical protein MFUL124B02_04440 [Myxococcus fulvus 124B02]
METRTGRLSLLLACAALLQACSGTAHSPMKRELYAQATCVDSATCCIQRNPGNPEACGLTTSEAATLMAGGKAVTSSEATGAAAASAEVWDDSHNAELPDWKRECIRFYGDCQLHDWVGKEGCFACFERCQGQQAWPLDLCRPRKKKG